MNNVIDDPAYSDVKKRLKEELDSLMKQYGDSDSLRQEMLKKDLNR
jgi:hypothetical protein